MAVTITFAPTTRAITVSVPMYAGQTETVTLVNSDHSTEPVSSAGNLRLVMKIDNNKSGSAFILAGDWVAGVAGSYSCSINFNVQSLLDYLEDDDYKPVEVQVWDLGGPRMLASDFEVPMYNAVYRSGDAAEDPEEDFTVAVTSIVKGILAALDLDLVFTANDIGIVLLSRDSGLPKRLVVDDNGFLGTEDVV